MWAELRYFLPPLAIEDHFQINLPDQSPDFDAETAGGLVTIVERLLAEKADKEKAKA